MGILRVQEHLSVHPKDAGQVDQPERSRIQEVLAPELLSAIYRLEVSIRPH
jgi:hypothetical protein